MTPLLGHDRIGFLDSVAAPLSRALLYTDRKVSMKLGDVRSSPTGIGLRDENATYQRRSPALWIGQTRINGKRLLWEFRIREPAYYFEGPIPSRPSEKVFCQVDRVR